VADNDVVKTSFHLASAGGGVASRVLSVLPLSPSMFGRPCSRFGLSPSGESTPAIPGMYGSSTMDTESWKSLRRNKACPYRRCFLPRYGRAPFCTCPEKDRAANRCSNARVFWRNRELPYRRSYQQTNSSLQIVYDIHTPLSTLSLPLKLPSSM